MDLKRREPITTTNSRAYRSIPYPIPDRALKEIFGAALYLHEKYGEPSIADYLNEQVNQRFELPLKTPCQVEFKPYGFIYENEKVRVEYVHADSVCDRTVNIQEKN